MIPSPKKVARRHLLASLPKFPGVSAQRLKKLFDGLREDIIESATDAYSGAEWSTEWKVVAVDQYGDAKSCKLVSAEGKTSEVKTASFWELEKKLKKKSPEIFDAIITALAKEVSGSWDSQIQLGWKRDYMEPGLQPGDTHWEDSDAYYRGGNLSGVVEKVNVKIRLKVRASARRDGSIGYRASWKSA